MFFIQLIITNIRYIAICHKIYELGRIYAFIVRKGAICFQGQ